MALRQQNVVVEENQKLPYPPKIQQAKQTSKNFSKVVSY